ncbi:MAG: alpha/beta hydrolase [Thiotrichales bacterium]|nr:MAG: alpha/beta hydrolase [Thiotrichales bacterium]
MKKNSDPRQTLPLRFIQFAFSRFGPVFPGYFGNRAYQLWFTTHRFKRPAKENAVAHSAVRSTISINDIDITVWSWGEGKPVLFIHGWSGRGTQVVRFIDPLINSGYRVISFDGPAHGESPGKQTSMLELADVVLALNERHGPFHSTITHSFGGMVLAYACNKGFTTASAVCICPPAGIDSILDNFQRLLNIPDSVLSVMTKKLYAHYGDDLDNRVSTLNNVNALLIPALIVHDEDDGDLSWKDGKAVADAWPGAEFRLTHGLGHSRILRDPDTVATITNFVANQ